MNNKYVSYIYTTARKQFVRINLANFKLTDQSFLGMGGGILLSVSVWLYILTSKLLTKLLHFTPPLLLSREETPLNLKRSQMFTFQTMQASYNGANGPFTNTELSAKWK